LLARVNDTLPTLLFFENGNTSPVMELSGDKLNALPIVSLAKNGTLGLAKEGGNISIYNPKGELVTEAVLPNTEQKVVALRFTPIGTRFIVVADSALGNTVYVYAAATLVLTHTINSIPITFIGTADSGIMISGNDGYGRFYNFNMNRFIWQVFGNVTAFMAEDGGALMSVIQTQNPQDTIIAIALLTDGTILRSQAFTDLGRVVAFMKANDYGKYGVIVSDRIMRFLP